MIDVRLVALPYALNGVCMVEGVCATQYNMSGAYHRSACERPIDQGGAENPLPHILPSDVRVAPMASKY